MRKASLFTAVFLLAAAAMAAQTARPALTGQYLEQSFSRLNLDNLLVFFNSPAFKMLMLLVIGASLVIWSIYLWASVQIALENGTPVAKKRIWTWPRSVRIPAGIPADPDLPHTQVWHFGRAGLSPNIVLVEHKPADFTLEETDDTPSARSENSARRS